MRGILEAIAVGMVVGAVLACLVYLGWRVHELFDNEGAE